MVFMMVLQTNIWPVVYLKGDSIYKKGFYLHKTTLLFAFSNNFAVFLRRPNFFAGSKLVFLKG